MKIELIPTWRSFWRFWSVRFALLGSALLTYATVFPDAVLQAWLMLPPDLKALVPPHWAQIISVGLFFMSVFARLVKQQRVEDIYKPKEPDQ